MESNFIANEIVVEKRVWRLTIGNTLKELKITNYTDKMVDEIIRVQEFVASNYPKVYSSNVDDPVNMETIRGVNNDLETYANGKKGYRIKYYIFYISPQTGKLYFIKPSIEEHTRSVFEEIYKEHNMTLESLDCVQCHEIHVRIIEEKIRETFEEKSLRETFKSKSDIAFEYTLKDKSLTITDYAVTVTDTKYIHEFNLHKTVDRDGIRYISSHILVDIGMDISHHMTVKEGYKVSYDLLYVSPHTGKLYSMVEEREKNGLMLKLIKDTEHLKASHKDIDIELFDMKIRICEEKI